MIDRRSRRNARQKIFTASLLLPNMKMTKHHDEAKNPERAKRRSRKRARQKIFTASPIAAQREDDKIKKVGGEQDEKFFRTLLLLPITKMIKRRSKKLGKWQAEKISNDFVPAARQENDEAESPNKGKLKKSSSRSRCADDEF